MPLPESKLLVVIDSSSTTDGGTASGNVDTLGADYVIINTKLGTADVVSNKPTVLKLAESDDTVVTNFADITAFVGGTAFTIPNSDTTNPNLYVFAVDTRHRKRFLKVSVSPQTTQIVDSMASLFRNGESPNTAAKAGVDVLVAG